MILFVSYLIISI